MSRVGTPCNNNELVEEDMVVNISYETTVNDRLSAAALICIFPVKDAALISKTGKTFRVIYRE